VVTSGKPVEFETFVKPLGIWFKISVYTPHQGYFVAVFQNITERKMAEEKTTSEEVRLKSLVNILQYDSVSIQEFLDHALDEAIKLTASKIGYIYFYDAERQEFVLNSWSREVMKECTIQEKQTIYSLDKTGIWGEAVRQNKPIVVNDFQGPNQLKKGYPEGHVELFKFLTVPIHQNNRIVALAAVANKETDYDETDVLQMTVLLEAVWKTVEAKMAEENLKASETRYRRLFETAKDGILILDANTGQVEDANPFLIQLLGYSYDQFKGKKIWELGFIKDTFANKANFEELVLKKYVRYEDLPLEAANGLRKDVEFVSNVYEVDHQKVIQCNIRDISERKITENAIRLNEERYRIVADFTHDWEYWLGADGRFRYISPSCESLTGYTPEEFIADPTLLTHIVHAEDQEDVTSHISSIIAGNRDKTEMRFRINTKDGLERWLGHVCQPVFSAGGEFIGRRASNRDITDTVNNEKQVLESRALLVSMNAELEQKIIERTAEITKAELELRSLSSRLLKVQEEERRSIARELHDEIGQNLTVLKLMLGRAQIVVHEDVKPLIKEISGTALELLKHVRNLSMSLRPGVLDELGLIPALESLFKQLNEQAGLRVHFYPQYSGQLSADTSITLYRIAQEALTNVMRYSGVKEVFVKLWSQDGTLRLRIEDNGHGFAPALLEAHRSTGLSAMKERAALVGGRCTIESEPLKGTVVTVDLPFITQIK
jgi:PAS domain S-box-containing protein